MKIPLPSFLAILLILFSSRCMYAPENFTEQTLVLAKNETIRIKQLDLQISNKGCGRNWLTKEAGERPFCDVEVRAGDSLCRFGGSFEPLYIKNIVLIMDRMNPWGIMEDSVPPGGCRIIVRKLPDGSR